MGRGTPTPTTGPPATPHYARAWHYLRRRVFMCLFNHGPESSGRVAAGYPLLRGYLSQKSSGLSLALPHFSFVILQLVQVGAESLSNWERASANGIAPFLLHLLAGHNLLLPAAVEMCL